MLFEKKNVKAVAFKNYIYTQVTFCSLYSTHTYPSILSQILACMMKVSSVGILVVINSLIPSFRSLLAHSVQPQIRSLIPASALVPGINTHPSVR